MGVACGVRMGIDACVGARHARKEEEGDIAKNLNDEKGKDELATFPFPGWRSKCREGIKRASWKPVKGRRLMRCQISEDWQKWLRAYLLHC